MKQMTDELMGEDDEVDVFFFIEDSDYNGGNRKGEILVLRVMNGVEEADAWVH